MRIVNSRVVCFLALALSAAAGAAPAGQSIKVASISFVPQKLDLAGNANRLEAAFRAAAAGGAQLAVASEGSLDALTSVKIRCRLLPPKRIYDTAITLDSATMKRFRSLARELNMCLAFGFAERIGNDVYNSAVFIDNHGLIRSDYHKMELAEGYEPSHWYNRLGARCRAFDTPFGRCGLLICNDRWNPDLARILALDGAAFILIPSAGNATEKNDQAVLARARENDLPIVEANACVNPLTNRAQTRSVIVDQGGIVAADSRPGSIIYATVHVPPDRKSSPTVRDALESAFLRWRETEMPKRYQDWEAMMDKLQHKPGYGL